MDFYIPSRREEIIDLLKRLTGKGGWSRMKRRQLVAIYIEKRSRVYRNQ